MSTKKNKTRGWWYLNKTPVCAAIMNGRKKKFLASGDVWITFSGRIISDSDYFSMTPAELRKLRKAHPFPKGF